MAKIKYKRILLKLSGEVFKGELERGIDGEYLMGLAKDIKKVQDLGAEIGIVLGGGNIWRFRDFQHLDFLTRNSSDTMGMLATIMNSLAFESALKEVGAKVRVVSAFPCEKAVEDHVIKKSDAYLSKGNIVIFAGGTGSPNFTTDSAAALRALEMNCDVLMKATKVDYVYDKDPVKNSDAKKFEEMTFQDIIEMNLGVMDLTCASLCKDRGMPMLVFNLEKSGSIEAAVKGKKIGTIIN